MDYTMQDHKTKKKLFATGLNCDLETARDQMVMTKRRLNSGLSRTSVTLVNMANQEQLKNQVQHYKK
jgi:hypothetical protein